MLPHTLGPADVVEHDHSARHVLRHGPLVPQRGILLVIPVDVGESQILDLGDGRRQDLIERTQDLVDVVDTDVRPDPSRNGGAGNRTIESDDPTTAVALQTQSEVCRGDSDARAELEDRPWSQGPGEMELEPTLFRIGGGSCDEVNDLEVLVLDLCRLGDIASVAIHGSPCRVDSLQMLRPSEVATGEKVGQGMANEFFRPGSWLMVV